MFRFNKEEKRRIEIAMNHHIEFLDKAAHTQSNKTDARKLSDLADITIELKEKLLSVSEHGLPETDAEIMNELQKRGIIK